jgi:hypothetical protein
MAFIQKITKLRRIGIPPVKMTKRHIGVLLPVESDSRSWEDLGVHTEFQDFTIHGVDGSSHVEFRF